MRFNTKACRLFFLLLCLFGLLHPSGLRALEEPISVLLLYHEAPPGKPTGFGNLPLDVVQLSNLLGHFRVRIAHVPVDEYTEGILRDYDAVVYLGSTAGQNIPKAFLDDVPRHPKKVVLWIRHNIGSLLDRHGTFYGVGVQPLRGGFESLIYQDKVLPRMDAEMVHPILITDWDRVRSLGALQSTTGTTPFAVHAKNLWYFPDRIFEGAPHLVFCDLLHGVFEIPHNTDQRFFLRVEDVHPLRVPRKFRAITRMLTKLDCPFAVSVVPMFQEPKKPTRVLLEERPYLVAALQEGTRRGAAILMHGYTHQWKNESGEGHEFWDVARDRPIDEYTDDIVHTKMDNGIRTLTQLGLYPVGWETPHYAASQQNYRIIAQHFSMAVEQRQLSDKTHKITQGFPFIVKDIFGQTLVPENLGFINFELGETIEKKLATAALHQVVRDAVVGVFYHPYYDAKYLIKLVEGLKKLGFTPLDLRDIPSVALGKDAIVFSGIGTRPFPVLDAARSITPDPQSPRTVCVELKDQWLHTFCLDYKERMVEEYWSSEPIRGNAMVSLPDIPKALFVLEKRKERQAAAVTAWDELKRILIGRTGNPLETVQRWLVWGLLVITSYLFLRVLLILFTRTAYHRSHYRKTKNPDA